MTARLVAASAAGVAAVVGAAAWSRRTVASSPARAVGATASRWPRGVGRRGDRRRGRATAAVGGRRGVVVVARARRQDDDRRRRRRRRRRRAHRRPTLARPSWTTLTTRRPSAAKMRAAGEAPRRARRERVLVVQQPLVGAERAVEPHRVVEAGHLHPRAVPRQAERQHGRVEQRHVAGVRHDARVDDRVVGQLAVGPQPHPLAVGRHALAADRVAVDVAHVDRAGPVVPLAHLVLVRRHPGVPVRERLGVGQPGGIVIWWSGPGSGAWKLACRLKIARPCWMATTRRVREAATVAEAVDLVEDRHRRVAGAQEVGVLMALEFASDRCKDTFKVVMNAVINDGISLQFASDRLKDNDEIVTQAIRQNIKAIQFASDRIQKNLLMIE